MQLRTKSVKKNVARNRTHLAGILTVMVSGENQGRDRGWGRIQTV